MTSLVSDGGSPLVKAIMNIFGMGRAPWSGVNIGGHCETDVGEGKVREDGVEIDLVSWILQIIFHTCLYSYS